MSKLRPPQTYRTFPSGRHGQTPSFGARVSAFFDRFRARGYAWRTVVCGVLALGVAHVAAASAQLYRFTNEDGRLEIAHSIPNDRVMYGYEVIDSRSGRVIRTVQAQLSPEEYARKRERERCQAALQRLDKLYQSEEDIKNAQSMALASIDNRIAHARANMAHLRTQRTEFESRAAELERGGRKLPQGLVRNLEKTTGQIDTLVAEIEQREQDRNRAKARYDDDLLLFKEQDCLVLTSR